MVFYLFNMYYTKIFLFFSLIGFIMESTLFKIINCQKHSGIFYGPMTAVYGIGILSVELINKYFFKKIKLSKSFKIIIEYLILTIVLSLIEYLGGTILNLLFNIDMWNYSDKFLCINKYICLQNSLIWGLLGLIYIYVIKKFTDKIINIITTKETTIFLIIFIIDTITVLITKT